MLRNRRGPRAGLLAVVVTGAASVLLAGCTEQPSVARAGDSDAGDGVTVQAGLTRYDTSERSAAPTVSGPAVSGTATVSSSHPGKVVVINVWQSTCGPCRLESTALDEAAKQTAREATFLGLDVRDQQVSAQAFLRTSRSTYAHIYDPDGQQLLKFTGILPIQAIPSTLVIDREGRVAARIVGAVSATSLTQLIDETAAPS